MYKDIWKKTTTKGEVFTEVSQCVQNCCPSLREELSNFTANALDISVLRGAQELAYDETTEDVVHDLDLQGDLTDIDKLKGYVKDSQGKALADALDTLENVKRTELNNNPPE